MYNDTFCCKKVKLEHTEHTLIRLNS